MSEPASKPLAADADCRIPTLADATAIHALVDRCKPLDLNSQYAYLLLSAHFAQTCVVAEIDERLAGFVSSYRKPTDPSVLFVWQVAVGPDARGQGLGLRMLSELMSREPCQHIRWIETTITPSNQASWALFESFAKRRGASCIQQPFFQAEHFGGIEHEEERLLRIGPLHPKPKD